MLRKAFYFTYFALSVLDIGSLLSYIIVNHRLGFKKKLHLDKFNVGINTGKMDSNISDDYFMRFNNVAKLYDGNPTDIVKRLATSHICVIGLGGVGSWVVEGLARSGIGRFTLIDMDDICISNINRQIMATTSTVGQFKAETLKKRILDINPDGNVTIIIDFIRPNNAIEYLTIQLEDSNQSLQRRFDYIIDAADGVSDKCAIIDACVRTGTPIVTSGGVGGLTDPSLITISDMVEVVGDNLLMRVRKKLRQKYGYPLNPDVKKKKSKKIKKWGVSAVHTLPTGKQRGIKVKSCDSFQNINSVIDSDDLKEDNSENVLMVNGNVDISNEDESSLRKCDVSFGNACFSTGTVGLLISGIVVNAIGNNKYVIPRKIGNSFEEKSPMNKSYPVKGIQPNMEIFQNNYFSPNDVSSCYNNQSIKHQEREKIGYEVHTFNIIESLTNTKSNFTLFDAHCHLQLDSIYPYLPQVLSRSASYGIQQMAVCGTCPGEDWDRVYQIGEKHSEFIIPSYGLHPWWIKRYQKICVSSDENQLLVDEEINTGKESSGRFDTWMNDLEEKLIANPKASVGECGLDKAVKKDISMEEQEIILIQHLNLAVKYNRTLTVHCVAGSWGQLISILKEQIMELNKSLYVILHSCNSLSKDLAKDFIAIPNIYFSISGRVLDNKKSVDLIKSLPMDRLLIETDSPDQLTNDMRSKLQFNEPALLVLYCSEIASILDCSANELAAVTSENARRAFHMDISNNL
eukprot:gene9120-12301_t